MTITKTVNSIAATQKSIVSELGSHIGFWLRFVSNAVSGRFAQSIEALGVSVSEWVALRSMYEHGESSSTELMVALGMTKGAISKIISRLEKKGLVIRKYSGEDRRNQTIYLTCQGKALVPELARIADQNDAYFFGHLPIDQQVIVLNIMKQVVDNQGLKEVPVQ